MNKQLKFNYNGLDRLTTFFRDDLRDRTPPIAILINTQLDHKVLDGLYYRALLYTVLEKCCFHLKVAFLLSSKMSLLFTISEINVVVYFLENLHFNLAGVSDNINSALVPTINQKIMYVLWIFCIFLQSPH